MPTITRPQLAVYAAAAVAIALIGARYLHSAQPARAPAGAQRTPAASVTVGAGAGGSAIVQVVGAVHRPGVYRMSTEERVHDAVRRAGGATARADLAAINLAAKVNDGQQVVVPVRGASAAAAATGAGTGAAVPGGAPGQPLNLNAATAEQLDQLDGVGPATAQKIVAYRQQHGGFRSVSELDQVPGIGEKKLAALRDKVRV